MRTHLDNVRDLLLRVDGRLAAAQQQAKVRARPNGSPVLDAQRADIAEALAELDEHIAKSVERNGPGVNAERIPRS